MVNRGVRHSRTPRLAGASADLIMPLAGTVILIVLIGLSAAFSADRGDALTRNTIRLSLAWYAAALWLMMRLGPADWAAATQIGRTARWCWTWAVVVFLIHLAMAFHYFHHWSHAHAFAHTRLASGVGEGLYVSYLFTALWMADVAYWWLQPRGYADRPAWVDRALHMFMLLIVFNGTVVFEGGFIRWAGAVIFVALAWAWASTRRRPLGGVA
jgi:hypothetical protein